MKAGRKRAEQVIEMIQVMIGPYRAWIRDYVWKADDLLLERLLNARLARGGPSGSDPDPDWNAARQAVAELGGVILTRRSAPPAGSSEEIY